MLRPIPFRHLIVIAVTALVVLGRMWQQRARYHHRIDYHRRRNYDHDHTCRRDR